MRETLRDAWHVARSFLVGFATGLTILVVAVPAFLVAVVLAGRITMFLFNAIGFTP